MASPDPSDPARALGIAADAPLDPRPYSTFLRLVSDPNHKLVVCFGGGSVPGLAGNLALARVLEELDLRPKVTEVWGTSAGAVVGGAWASGTPALEILADVKGLDRRNAVDVPWLKLAAAILKKPFGGRLPDGLIEGRHFAGAIQNALRVATIEDCPIPFRCIACTDDGESQRKVFRRGPLLPAILSSMSIPGIVVPRPRLAGEACGYYDGGLVEKTPLLSPIADHGRSGDTRRLLLLGTHFGNDARRTPARGFIYRFLQSIYTLECQLWDHQLAEARAKKNVQILLLNPHIEDATLFDFSRVQANYTRARAAFSDLLQNAKLALTLGTS